MASDDRHERVREVLAVALAVFLTYKKWRLARTLAEWALVLDVLNDIDTTEREEGEDDDGPRAKRTRQVHPRSDFSHAPWYIMLRKAEPKRRGSREAINFRRRFRIPYELILELVKWQSKESSFHWLQGNISIINSSSHWLLQRT